MVFLSASPVYLAELDKPSSWDYYLRFLVVVYIFVGFDAMFLF